MMIYCSTEIKKLEKQREEFEIPNEESITAYYKIRQQLKKLADDMLVRICVLCMLLRYYYSTMNEQMGEQGIGNN